MRTIAPSVATMLAILGAIPTIPRDLDAAVRNVPSTYATIQAAVDAAAPGDTVLVAPGTYAGPGNRDIDFYGKNLLLTSSAGRDSTVIDCQGAPGIPHRGFYFHSSESPAAVVQGFTIQNGNEDQPTPNDRGAAILCENSSPTIRHNRLVDCSAIYTGGIMLWHADAVIDSNIILRCNGAGNGGGIRCYASSPLIRWNVIDSCSSTSGGGIEFHGLDSRPVFEWNTLLHNWATAYGGAVFCTNRASPTIRHCTIMRNRSGGYSGGSGGGIAVWDSGQVVIENSILWADSLGAEVSELHVETGASATLWGSDVDMTGLSGGGDKIVKGGCNISSDPLLCAWPFETCQPEMMCFLLRWDSPCLPRDSCGLIGAWADTCSWVGVDDRVTEADGLRLETAAPNPFRGRTVIGYWVPPGMVAGEVRLRVYDVQGRLIRTLVAARQAAGPHRVVWDGKGEGGRPVPGGVYLCQLRVDGVNESRRLIVLR